jgi:Na+/melibiose symporter-like transporter
VSLAWWLLRRKRRGQVPLLDPDLLRSPNFRLGVSAQMLQQIALGGAMIALPIFLQMVLEYNALQAGLSLAPLSLSMFAVAMLAGRRAGNQRPAVIIRIGFILLVVGMATLLPLVPRADSGLWLAVPLAVAGCGFGLLVSQLNNFTLAPIDEERISEAAGVNSAAGSFGLSFGLAIAGGLMLASLAVGFSSLAAASPVLSDAEATQVAAGLEEDAQLMSNTQLEELIVNQPADIEAEIIRINTEARPLALQIALLVPLLAGLIGVAVSFGMIRLPDIKPTADLEAAAFG